MATEQLDMQKLQGNETLPAISLPVASSEVPDSLKYHRTTSAIFVHLVLVLVQLGYAGFQTLSRVALVGGVNPFSFTFYRNLTACVFLAPAAYYFERDLRPKMSLRILGSFNLLAFFGILGNQQFFLAGQALTSPLFTAVVQNMVPVVTFMLAAASGMEKISFRKLSGLAKILGTMICVTGAATMTLYKGVTIYNGGTGQNELDEYVHTFKPVAGEEFYQHLVHIKFGRWQLGALCLLLNVSSWSLYLIHQGPVLLSYPALLSMATYVELFGSMQIACVAIAFEGELKFADFRLLDENQIIIILYAGIIASGVNFALQAWCVQKVGAFLVSLYTPFLALLVACLATLILRDSLHLGILVGALLIVGGFYFVVYGQQMENSAKGSALDDTCSSEQTGQSDLEISLLS